VPRRGSPARPAPTIGALEPEPADTREGLSRRALTLVLVPIILLSVMGTVANAVFPALLSEHPLLLVALQPRFRYLVATANLIDPLTFYAVALTAKLVTDPLYFLLGDRYGDRAVRWIEHKMGAGEYVLMVERWFKRARDPVVFLFPGALVCVLAGTTHMRLRRFALLNVGGTLTTLTFVQLVGDVLEGPIGAFIRFNERYMWWLTGISIVLVALSFALREKKGTSELESIAEIERELEAGSVDRDAEGS